MHRSMPLKAILFDKDGTLVDFHATWSAATYAIFHRLASGDEDKVARLAQASDYDLTTRLIGANSPLIAASSADYGVVWAEILGEAPDERFFARMDEVAMQEANARLVALGEPAAILGLLRAEGYVLGIVTNDSEAGARAHCDILGLTSLLDVIFGYDSGHGRKPEPGPVLAFAARNGLEPQEVALVGDSLHDLHAARAAGAVAIAVLSGLAGAEDLGADADHVVADIAALPGLLRSLAEPAP